MWQRPFERKRGRTKESICKSIDKMLQNSSIIFGAIFCIGLMHTLSVCINNSKWTRLWANHHDNHLWSIHLYRKFVHNIKQASLLKYTVMWCCGNASSLWIDLNGQKVFTELFFFSPPSILFIGEEFHFSICLCLQALCCANNFLRFEHCPAMDKHVTNILNNNTPSLQWPNWSDWIQWISFHKRMESLEKR